jgi:hypothetical protein
MSCTPRVSRKGQRRGPEKGHAALRHLMDCQAPAGAAGGVSLGAGAGAAGLAAAFFLDFFAAFLAFLAGFFAAFLDFLLDFLAGAFLVFLALDAFFAFFFFFFAAMSFTPWFFVQRKKLYACSRECASRGCNFLYRDARVFV